MEIENIDAFSQRFPVNTILTIAEFDTWLDEQGLEPIPAAEPGSNIWSGHVMRRNQLRTVMNRRALSTGMGFQIEVLKHNETYIVRSAKDSASVGVPRFIQQTGVGTIAAKERVQKVLDIAASADLDLFSRLQIAQLSDEIERFAKRIKRESDEFLEEVEKVETKVRQRLKETGREDLVLKLDPPLPIENVS